MTLFAGMGKNGESLYESEGVFPINGYSRKAVLLVCKEAGCIDRNEFSIDYWRKPISLLQVEHYGNNGKRGFWWFHASEYALSGKYINRIKYCNGKWVRKRNLDDLIHIEEPDDAGIYVKFNRKQPEKGVPRYQLTTPCYNGKRKTDSFMSRNYTFSTAVIINTDNFDAKIICDGFFTYNQELPDNAEIYVKLKPTKLMNFDSIFSLPPVISYKRAQRLHGDDVKYIPLKNTTIIEDIKTKNFVPLSELESGHQLHDDSQLICLTDGITEKQLKEVYWPFVETLKFLGVGRRKGRTKKREFMEDIAARAGIDLQMDTHSLINRKLTEFWGDAQVVVSSFYTDKYFLAQDALCEHQYRTLDLEKSGGAKFIIDAPEEIWVTLNCPQCPQCSSHGRIAPFFVPRAAIARKIEDLIRRPRCLDSDPSAKTIPKENLMSEIIEGLEYDVR